MMKSATTGQRNGIQWTLWTQLDDLDFTDDIALISHTQRQMQDKTNLVNDLSDSIGLSINSGKSKVLRINTRNEAPTLLRGEALDEVDSFTYLCSIVTKDGWTEADITDWIGKARAAFKQLKNVWRSGDLSRKTKIRIFNSNVKSVLYYGSETWKTSITNSNKLQTFLNSCLRQILHIRWPEVISNEMLWERTDQTPAHIEKMEMDWSYFTQADI